MLKRIINKWMARVTAIVIIAVAGISCDKEPVGPTGPDPFITPAPGTYISIKDFRALYPGSGDFTIPAGTKKLYGVVISNNANEAAGNYRIQDDSGSGLYLYTVVGSPVYPVGTVLEVDAAGAGVFTLWNGDLELKSVPQAKVVSKSGTFAVVSREATIAEIITNKNTWASSLIKIKNITSIVQASSNSTGVTYNVTDATGTLSMFVRTVSGITVNTSATAITGYVSIYNTATQIGIRSAADLQ
ncbi:MAG: hypothetical protein IPH18_13050 [Chitinophagaceae bacterium]|nr:hypothetical protein [Chitinophagaceae bacterium]